MNPNLPHSPRLPPPPERVRPEPAPATWLPGVVLAWALGTLIYGLCVKGGGGPDDLGAALGIWAAYGVFFGYSCGQEAIWWAVAFAPPAGAIGLLMSGDPAIVGVGVTVLVVCFVLTALVLVFGYVRPFGIPPVVYVVLLMLLAAVGSAASSDTRYLSLLLLPTACAMAWTLVGWLCFAFVALGSLLRAMFYGRAAGSLERIPERLWPARFTLRDMFRWTTWLAVIFALLGLLHLAPADWLHGTLNSIIAIGAAAAVIWVKPRGKKRTPGDTMQQLLAAPHPSPPAPLRNGETRN